MPTYKNQFLNSIDYLADRLVEDDESIIVLHDFAITSAGKSLEDLQGIAYQVPAGNTLTVYVVIVHHVGTGANFKIWSGDSDNASTNVRLQLQLPALIDQFTFPCDFEIASGKYITVTFATGTIPSCIVIGVLRAN